MSNFSPFNWFLMVGIFFVFVMYIYIEFENSSQKVLKGKGLWVWEEYSEEKTQWLW